MHLLGDQLQHVEVARDDVHLPAVALRRGGDGANDVIRLVAGCLKERESKRRDQISDDRHLGAKLVGHGRPLRLVRGEALVPIGGAWGIKGHDGTLRINVRHRSQQDAGKAVRGVGELAAAVRQWRQRVEGAVDQPIGINEEESALGWHTARVPQECRALRLGATPPNTHEHHRKAPRQQNQCGSRGDGGAIKRPRREEDAGRSVRLHIHGSFGGQARCKGVGASLHARGALGATRQLASNAPEKERCRECGARKGTTWRGAHPAKESGAPATRSTLGPSLGDPCDLAAQRGASKGVAGAAGLTDAIGAQRIVPRGAGGVIHLALPTITVRQRFPVAGRRGGGAALRALG